MNTTGNSKTATTHYSKEAIQAFLDTTRFSGYQSVPLPHGLRLPGRNLIKRANHILGGHVRGKSLLDVGTVLWLFPLRSQPSWGNTRGRD